MCYIYIYIYMSSFKKPVLFFCGKTIIMCACNCICVQKERFEFLTIEISRVPEPGRFPEGFTRVPGRVVGSQLEDFWGAQLDDVSGFVDKAEALIRKQTGSFSGSKTGKNVKSGLHAHLGICS